MKFWLWGKHVVKSILEESKREVYEIITVKKELVPENIKKNIRITIVDKNKIEKLCGKNHQGIAAFVSDVQKCDLKNWIIANKNSSKSIIACDLIEDEKNLGAIMRSSMAFNITTILITKQKRAQLGGSLAKAAAGALEKIEIIEVSNLSTSLKALYNEGYDVLGLDEDGTENWPELEKFVLVLGQEGKGLRRLTKESCNHIIRIKTNPEFGTLNVSVAAAVAMSKLKK